MKLAKFCDLSPGTRFIHRGRVYQKLRKNLARDEARARAVFPTEAEVSLIEPELPSPEIFRTPYVSRDVKQDDQDVHHTGMVIAPGAHRPAAS